jgi:hypothetical protein
LADVCGDDERDVTGPIASTVCSSDTFCPCPDLVIFLEVPAEMLFDRQGVRTSEILDRLWAGYAELEHAVDGFALVDAT